MEAVAPSAPPPLVHHGTTAPPALGSVLTPHGPSPRQRADPLTGMPTLDDAASAPHAVTLGLEALHGQTDLRSQCRTRRVPRGRERILRLVRARRRGARVLARPRAGHRYLAVRPPHVPDDARVGGR